MTTIDERLSEILLEYSSKQFDANYEDNDELREDSHNDTKAAIKSLFLDLIAEAKPNPDDYDDRQNFVADQFENNLIQAIGER